MGSPIVGDRMMGLYRPVPHNGNFPVVGRWLISAGVAALAVAAVPQAGVAQTRSPAGSISQPVVQSLPDRNSLTLNRALARLGQNARDVDALIDAGNAALAMGDVEASVGFFRRADQLSPANARVKAGLAGALVHSENPYEAIPLFEEAERLGAATGGADAALAGERGLAYDLVGDHEKAQRYYLQALQRQSDDEIIRRLALSYAMAGDTRNAETTLTPLLQRQDKAAWRTRAFSLAIMGQVDEAVSIANTTLPPNLAAGVSPYLRYMPRLTPAQQAAAANLGHFPRASEIGRDDPRVAQYAPKTPRRAAPAQVAADAALTPRGEPLGRRDKTRDRRETRRDRQARTDTTLIPRPSTTRGAPSPASPSARPARTASASPARPAGGGELPPLQSSPSRSPAAASVATPAPAPAPRPAAFAPSSLPLVPSRTPSAQAPTPGFSLAPPAQTLPASTTPPFAPPRSPPAQAAAASAPPLASTTPSAAPAPTAPAPVPPPRPVSLTEAFSDLLAPPKVDVAPVPGAVDVRRLTPSRQAEARPAETKTPAGKSAAAKPAKPPPPSHPSRIWVQVATGRAKPALAFDWRRMTRENAQALRGKQGFISAWGQTNRLLTGPFPSEAAANAFLAQLRRAGLEGSFLWTSPAGQVVDPIATK